MQTIHEDSNNDATTIQNIKKVFPKRAYIYSNISILDDEDIYEKSRGRRSTYNSTAPPTANYFAANQTAILRERVLLESKMKKFNNIAINTAMLSIFIKILVEAINSKLFPIDLEAMYDQ